MAYVFHLYVLTDVGFHASEKWHKIQLSIDYGITFYLYQFLGAVDSYEMRCCISEENVVLYIGGADSYSFMKCYIVSRRS